MSNKKSGNQFESELCEILSMYGFWCHNLAQNSAGQPADVIAVRNREAYLIDCKVCSTNKGFALNRMEENQDLAMNLWNECGNGQGIIYPVGISRHQPRGKSEVLRQTEHNELSEHPRGCGNQKLLVDFMKTVNGSL